MIDDVITACLIDHEQFLHQLITHAQIPALNVRKAINYTLFPPGKRLRPLLVYLCGKLLGLNQQSLHPIAASIELIHCYSLVHDDLPAMDNDNFRRGKPSCHRAFDEATAILVGDGLQALAIETLLTYLPPTFSPAVINNIVLELVKASGVSGMVSGQSLDLTELSRSVIDQEQLCLIHSLKTGKLMLACVNMVIIASENSDAVIQQSLRDFAQHLGLAFQMQDDYLDHYAEKTLLGKNRASDLANQKLTFAHLYAQQALIALINNHYDLIKQALLPFAAKAKVLLKLVCSLQQRHH